MYIIRFRREERPIYRSVWATMLDRIMDDDGMIPEPEVPSINLTIHFDVPTDEELGGGKKGQRKTPNTKGTGKLNRVDHVSSRPAKRKPVRSRSTKDASVSKKVRKA